MSVVLADWGVIGRGAYRAEYVASETKILDTHRLRYRVYCEELKQIPAEKFPSKAERDWCDDHSSVIVAMRNDELIGCIRLIDCSHGCLLDEGKFSGKEFNFPVVCGKEMLQRQTSVEASRWIGKMHTEQTGERVLVSRLLLEGALRYAQKNGIKGWVWALNVRVYNDLLKEGWPLQEFIPGVHAYHDAQVVVCGMSVQGSWGAFRRTA